MYEGHFQLQRRPFSATPDAKCFFASPEVQEVLDELLLRIEHGQGIGVLTAEAGTGKTLLCRRLALELAGSYTPVFLANANFPTRRALLQAILFEMQRRYSGMEEQELRLEVISALKELHAAGHSGLLIIDEAHLLNERLIEEVRTLATLTHDDQPLIRVILSGQLSLEEKLADPALEALNQRVTCHVYLEPLTREQSREYITFRMAWAGGDATRIFSSDALDAISHACNGLPRCLNQLCDHCLLLAYVAEQQQVSREIVNDALSDLKQLPLHWNESLPATSPLAALSAVTTHTGSSAIDLDDDTESLSESIETSKRHEAEFSSPTCIEVGAESQAAKEPMSDDAPETEWVVSTQSGRGHEARRSPILESRTAAVARNDAESLHSPIEEAVHDRYALLDARSLRLVGTFSDQGAIAVAGRGAASHESSQGGRNCHQSPPAATEATSMPAPTCNHEPRPDEIIDGMLPLLDEACRTESDATSLPVSGHQHENCDDEDIEERIGSDVLDVCLDVQRSLGNWGEEITTTDATASTYLHTDDLAGDPADSREEDFDVVEPEFGETSMRQPVVNRIPEIAAVDGGTELRQVPGPKYGRIFSTLRRKMSRQKGQF